MTTAQWIAATEVKSWLSDGAEVAFVDVRENGRHGDGHPFFSVSIPWSVFEPRLIELVPNPRVRLVLFDEGEGTVELAASRALDCGYRNVHMMENGIEGWTRAGFTLFQGVNVPSKTYGELLELTHHTPNLTAEQLVELQQTEPNHIIVDSRPYDEYHRFNIPGGVCCPNGELALRIGELAPDPETTIVVNCAGRTRSILGAETLRAFGVPNPVYALENGTQGWLLAGLQREEGATRSWPAAPSAPERLDTLRAMARKRTQRTGVRYIEADEAARWLADDSRSTWLFDVRSAEEYADDGLPGATHVLGGQLVQATDLYMGVRGGRAILVDDELVRAPMMAGWLYGMGHEVAVVIGGVSALRDHELPARRSFDSAAVASIEPADAQTALDNNALLVDLRSVDDYRSGHIDGARWSMRSHLDRLPLGPDRTIVLVADCEVVAALAAHRLSGLGCSDVRRLAGGVTSWQQAGLEVIASPDDAPLEDGMTARFHLHQRNNPNGSEEAARAYLAWEIGLVEQLDEQERGAFRLSHDR